MLAQIAAVTSYSFFVFLNAISIIPRISGSHIGNNALGYSFSQMVGTVKRVFIFIYPPLLGWITLNKGLNSLIFTILLSYFLSLFFILLSYLMRFFLVEYFKLVIKDYSEGKGLLKSAFYSLCRSRGHSVDQIDANFKCDSSERLNWKIFYTSAWVFLANGSSLFVINILGAIYVDKAPIVYQLVGIVNAFGTIVMAFFLDPMLSRIFETNKEHMRVYKSLTYAQYANSLFLGPSLILFVYFILN